MTKEQEALKLAQKAMLNSNSISYEMLNAITAIKEALAQPDHIRDDTKMMAQPAQEHDPWRMAQPKEHHALQVAAGSQAFYGFPTEPASASNAGGKCVTAGETAPNINKGKNV